MAYRQNRPAELDFNTLREYGRAIPRPPSSVYSNEDELEPTPTYVGGLLRNSSSASEALSGNSNSMQSFVYPKDPSQYGQVSLTGGSGIGGVVQVPERASSSNETDVSSVKELSWYNYNNSGTSVASTSFQSKVPKPVLNRPMPVSLDLSARIEALLLDPELNAYADAVYAELGENPAEIEIHDSLYNGGAAINEKFHNMPGNVQVADHAPPPAPPPRSARRPKLPIQLPIQQQQPLRPLNMDLVSDDEDDLLDARPVLKKSPNSNSKVQALLGIGIDYPVQVHKHKKSSSKPINLYDAMKAKVAASSNTNSTVTTPSTNLDQPWPSLNVRGKSIKSPLPPPPPRPPRSPPSAASSQPIMVPTCKGFPYRDMRDSYSPTTIDTQQQVVNQRSVRPLYSPTSNSGQQSPAMSSDTGSTIPDTNFLNPSTPTTPSTSPGAMISRFGDDSISDDFIDVYYSSSYTQEGDSQSLDSEDFVDEVERHSALHSEPLPYPTFPEQVTELDFNKMKAAEKPSHTRSSTAIFNIHEHELVLPERDHFKPIKITTPWYAFPDEYSETESIDNARHKELDRLARLPETKGMIAQAQQPAIMFPVPLPPMPLPPLHGNVSDNNSAPPDSPTTAEYMMSSRWSDYSSDEDERRVTSKWRKSVKSHTRTASGSSSTGMNKADFNLKKNVSKALGMKRRAAVPSSATFGSQHSPANISIKRSSTVPPTPAIDLRDLRVSCDSDEESQTTRAPDSWGPITHLGPTPPPLKFLPEAMMRPPTSVPTSAPTSAPNGGGGDISFFTPSEMPYTRSKGVGNIKGLKPDPVELAKLDKKAGKKPPLKGSKSFGTAQESGRSTPTGQLRSSKSTFDGWSMAASRNSTSKNSTSKNSIGKASTFNEGTSKKPKVQYGMWI